MECSWDKELSAKKGRKYGNNVKDQLIIKRKIIANTASIYKRCDQEFLKVV